MSQNNKQVNAKANKQDPVIIMAGGTGGHVFPALAVAHNLRARGENVIWLGTRVGIEARLVPEANFEIEWLSVTGLRGKGFVSLLLAPYKLLKAFIQLIILFRRIRPKAVLGMGGFVSGPGGLVAWVLNIPLFVHEQNSIIGLTNRLLSRLAKGNYFAFERAAKNVANSECIGNPIRPSLYNLKIPEKRLKGRDDQPLRLLVIGGSLGATALNRFVPTAVACLDKGQRPEIRHQCGVKHVEQAQQNYKQAGVEAEVLSFIDDMQQAYLWADLVVCRAGALTISELAAVGLASILIPYPYAVDNHQFHNAEFLQKRDAAEILLEADLSTESLALKLKYFQQNREHLLSMAINARKQSQGDAAEILASAILSSLES